MGKYKTHLSVYNATDQDMKKITIKEIDNYDWDGDCRPDHNFQDVKIKSHKIRRECENVNSNARSAYYRMYIEFSNGDKINFRNNQYDAREDKDRKATLKGRNSKEYYLHQISGDSENNFSVYSSHDKNKYLYYSNVVIGELQKKWDKKLISGYTWDGVHPWQRCVIAEALIDYSHLFNDDKHKDTIIKAIENRSGLSGNDDDLWSAIAAFKLYKWTRHKKFFGYATYQYKEITKKYEVKCNGKYAGVWWDYNKTYMSAITNELFLYLLTLLYKETKDSKYLEKAKKLWNWFKNSRLYDKKTNLINDGIHHDCDGKLSKNHHTYNQGVILGGLANLYKIEKDKSYLNSAINIALATIKSKKFTSEGILKEPQKDPTTNRRSFKGIFIRHLGYLYEVIPNSNKNKQIIGDFIEKNAKYVWEKANRNGKICYNWKGCSKKSNLNAANQGSGLDLFNSAYRITK